jgi:hypothetical protein
VLEEFEEEAYQEERDADITDPSGLAMKIEHFFNAEKAFLNPRLRLSDVAQAVASNRSYVSNYFNKELGVTFFDYVNNLRIEYLPIRNQELVNSLRRIHPRGACSFLVNPWGHVLTKQQNGDEWNPVYVCKLDYNKWFDKLDY